MRPGVDAAARRSVADLRRLAKSLSQYVEPAGAGETATAALGTPRMSVRVNSLIAVLDGIEHPLVSNRQAVALAKIVAANGDWVRGPSLSAGKTDRGLTRAMKSLPAQIAACIEPKRGVGRRLLPEYTCPSAS